MALKKSIKTEFGVDATYWKIIGIQISWHSKAASFQLAGWTDETTRKTAKPIISTSINFGQTRMGENTFVFSMEDNLIKRGYEEIKKRPEFKEAEDC